ncbi:TetR/AcrR family transcriptional regulator [Pleionea sp. CnH1-48]|uniref:TetR/AcrR family transcriptional regulator n=1 Tax=Pleionea sp. CnH1-48 TaxID=2954494 RepID=UPI002096B47A|nr:TetR/AcrR family transcriptional regulator [Pleionea sp. CnH1-48]MCO7226340.1 TetR/AcrR family transcriptional regulator [Pleionea sp. CnH1-48]
MTLQRNPDETRQRILDAALEEIHLRGFQGMRVDQLLERTGLTKGALYHHFANKMSIGYAIVEEILEKEILEKWVGPLAKTNNPVECIIEICRTESQSMSPDELEKGCPINNLSQEMSPIDEGFRERLAGVYQMWIESIANALRKGQSNNVIRKDIKPDNVAKFLLAALQGIIGVAKCCKSEESLDDMGECLGEYLFQLQTPEIQASAAQKKAPNLRG